MNHRYDIQVSLDIQRGFLWQLHDQQCRLVASGFAADKKLAQRVAETVRRLLEVD